MNPYLNPDQMKADKKVAFAAAAGAARHAAAMGWSPTSTGDLVVGNYRTVDGWQCCALGALALQHELDSQTDQHTMLDCLLSVEDMGLAETLAHVPGIKNHSWASRRVALQFDRLARTYYNARFGFTMDYVDRRVMEENNIADAEDFAHLSVSDFWLLVAKRFEQLAN